VFISLVHDRIYFPFFDSYQALPNMFAIHHSRSVSILLILLLHVHPFLAGALNPFANNDPVIGFETQNPPTNGNAPNLPGKSDALNKGGLELVRMKGRKPHY
jgi:hypothetical protein